MILVKLYTRDGGQVAEAGALEFYGVPVTKPDGSSWIEFGSLGEPGPGQVRLDPASIATGSEIRGINQALSRNEVRGQAGRYEWRAE
jgi:hypothetical protein